MLSHLFGTIFTPSEEWEKIRSNEEDIKGVFLKYTCIIAAIPAISAFIGATQVGWDIGDTTFKLTTGSTLPLIIGFYLACLAGIAIIGQCIWWMSTTYGAEKSIGTCYLLSSIIMTPLLVGGVFALIPIPWLLMLISLCTCAYSVYLLYTGISEVMEIDKDKGFLFASSVLTLGLVTIVGILVTTVILWNMGLMPQHV